MNQSPIHLLADEALPLANPLDLLEIKYPDADFIVSLKVKNGHGNFVFEAPAPGKLSPFPRLVFRDKTYRLAKIHVHEAPEHRIDDAHHQYELHLIHIPDGSDVESPLVVIGILYSLDTAESQHNRSGFEALGKLAKSKQDTKINPLRLFPATGGEADLTNWFHYEGSLTGYPYSETVSWFVMRSPGSITDEEVEELHSCAEQEARELQPLNRRLVVRSFSRLRLGNASPGSFASPSHLRLPSRRS